MIRLVEPDLRNLYEAWTEALSTLEQGSLEVKHQLRSIQSRTPRPLFPVATGRNANSIRRERGQISELFWKEQEKHWRSDWKPTLTLMIGKSALDKNKFRARE